MLWSHIDLGVVSTVRTQSCTQRMWWIAGGSGSGSNGGGSCSQLSSRRTYLVLHHVLKELSSKRLAADQKAFAEVGMQATGLGLQAVPGAWLSKCSITVITLSSLIQWSMLL